MTNAPNTEDLVPASVEWAILLPHATREALYLLDASLDLVEVARAVAADDAAVIKQALEANAMRRPSDGELSQDPGTAYEFVIVAPFVLAQRSQ